MSKPPLSIPPTSDTPLEVTLIIGAAKYTPLKAVLFDLVLPASHPAPVHPDEASFHDTAAPDTRPATPTQPATMATPSSFPHDAQIGDCFQDDQGDYWRLENVDGDCAKITQRAYNTWLQSQRAQTQPGPSNTQKLEPCTERTPDSKESESAQNGYDYRISGYAIAHQSRSAEVD